jgi:hypothetical protein
MRTLFLYSLIVLLSVSCSSYRYIDIQVLNPASISIPLKDPNIVFMMPGKMKVYSPKDSTKYFLHEIIKSDLTSILVKTLGQSPIFANFLDSSKAVSSNKDQESLLLKINFKFVLDTTFIKQLNSVDISYRFQFSLSNLKTKAVYDRFQIGNITHCYKYYIDRTVFDINSKVAEAYAHRIAPYWSTEERLIYYSGNRLMREGYNIFCMNALDSALTVWHRLYEVGTKRLGSMAAYNMALIYEMQDNLDSCEQWLVKSNNAKVRPSTLKYLDKIKKRKLERMSLEEQVKSPPLDI